MCVFVCVSALTRWVPQGLIDKFGCWQEVLADFGPVSERRQATVSDVHASVISGPCIDRS